MRSKLRVTQEGQTLLWTAKQRLLATALFCLSLAPPGVASAQSNGVPTADIATTCRTSEKTLIAIFGAETQQTFGSCMNSEKDAREQIVKNWQKYSAGARQRCVITTAYMPSYVEWLTCLEMEQQVNETRKKAATNPVTTEGRGTSAVARPGAPATSRGPKIGSESGPCPIVQSAPDGSIIGVIACPSPAESAVLTDDRRSGDANDVRPRRHSAYARARRGR
jgi:hypothetical protein